MNEKPQDNFRPGDTVKVYFRVKEGEKERDQMFQGVVIAKKHGAEPGATFTVRKISFGIGVERVFPLSSPLLSKVEVVRKGKVRRAKLFYLREKKGKASRIREKRLPVPAEGEAE